MRASSPQASRRPRRAAPSQLIFTLVLTLGVVASAPRRAEPVLSKQARELSPSPEIQTDASAPPQTPQTADLVTAPPWATRLDGLLSASPDADGELGVYVRHLGTQEAFSLRADEPWYLASGVKLPVAIVALRSHEASELPLDARVRLRASDRVDGTGHTNSHAPDALLRVDYLLEQMLIYSDNTATDMLIRHLGLERINQTARRLSGRDWNITTLADVRREVYGALHPKAAQLGYPEWRALRRTPEHRRVDGVLRLIGVDQDELALSQLDGAYDAYYAKHLNTAPLSAYGELLAQVATGAALGDASTTQLFDWMTRVRTGRRRLVSGLPRGTHFAHKTGTQYRRVCDFGIASLTPLSPATIASQIVIAACARNYSTTAAAERALSQVGAAIRDAGVLELSPPEPRRDDEPTAISQGEANQGPLHAEGRGPSSQHPVSARALRDSLRQSEQLPVP